MTKEFEVVEIGKDVDHGSEIKETQLPDVVLVIVKNFCTFHVLCVDDIFSRFYTSHLPMKAKFKCQYQVCHVFKAITCKINVAGHFSYYRKPTMHVSWHLTTTCRLLINDRGENWQLVTYELVEVQDCKKITNHFRGIYRIYPNLLKENRKMSTM